MRLAVAAIVVLWGAMPVFAHRLDEYLQATTISIGKDRVDAEVCLTPGVAVFADVLKSLDADGDGVISESEQKGYAGRVAGDLKLAVNGCAVSLRLVSSKFAGLEEMMEGRGEIVLDFVAEVPWGGKDRTLVFENHHQSRIAAYLVNCLVPSHPGIRVTGQERSYDQSVYRVKYVQDGGTASASSLSGHGWWGMAGLLPLAGLVVRWWRRRVG